MSTADDIARRASALTAAGRPQEALALTTGLAATPESAVNILMAHATALKALGRPAEALPFNRRVIERDPANRIGWYNYGATLGDLDRGADSEAALRRAMTLGLDRPEVHLALARALTTLQRFDEAEQAFEAVLTRDPVNPAGHRDLAQLIWMRTGDAERALNRLTSSLTGGPADIPLIRIQFIVLQFSGDLAAATAVLEAAVARQPHPALLLDLAGLKVHEGDWYGALVLLQKVLAMAPGARPAFELQAQACLVAGEPLQALRIVEGLRAADPHDQLAILIQTTAWRMLGDSRAEAFTAPDRFIRAHRLPTPDGWASLDAFLADLSPAVRRLHGLKAHPIQQSLRGGSQTQALLTSDEPVIQAFFRSVDRVVADHIAWLGAGDDPVRSRITGSHRVKAAWSVLLRPKGFHVNHFHPEGWLSSAFYVETPAAAVDAGDHQGWLKFGQPAIPTNPTLPPQHFVRPEPGTLVLFPSYLWHGTEAFTTDEARMSIAFDIVPV